MKKHQRALYRCMMMMAAIDKDFDERENEVILAFLNQLFGDETRTSRFVAAMNKEFQHSRNRKEFLTSAYFDKQVEALQELSLKTRNKILALMRNLALADGRRTFGESFLFEKMQKAFTETDTE